MPALSDMQLARQMDLAFKASYFIGRYYFSVNTRKKREDYGLLPDQEISIDIQHKLREDNIISLFHEYIHYIHEISTVVGNLYLNLDLVQKSIFSRYFSPDLKSSTHNGINKGNASDRRMNAESYFTKEVLNGSSVTDAKITKVLGIEYQTTPFYLVGGETIEEEIQVPILFVEKHEQGKFVIEKVNFGKFFIYEGLAYELDRELDKQLRGLSDIRDDNAYSEYTVLRLLANYVYPGVNKYTFLCLASLSLSFMDIGLTFIRLLEKTRAAVESGKKLDDVIHL